VGRKRLTFRPEIRHEVRRTDARQEAQLFEDESLARGGSTSSFAVINITTFADDPTVTETELWTGMDDNLQAMAIERETQ
jgi:hypothetical protein